MKYIKKEKFVLLITIIFVAFIATTTFAHSGRTDSKGGHKDNKNVSGLGSYHYHCGGYPAHLHTNGVCPYASPKVEEKVPEVVKVVEEVKEEKVPEVVVPVIEKKEEKPAEVVVPEIEKEEELEETENENINNTDTSETGLGTLILLGGAGYLGYKKFKG